MAAPQGPIRSLQDGAIDALGEADADRKAALTLELARNWAGGALSLKTRSGLAPPDRPGRPALPQLVPPNQVKKRSLGSARGRSALVHAICHIELNAIDLALDIIARFCAVRLPRSFFDSWMGVAADEARHFSLLRARLQELGHDYGDFPAHDGLWEAAQATQGDLTARLALVPLVLEARGLDVTPGMITALEAAGDSTTAAIFAILYEDEKGHVAVGAKWFRFMCRRQGVDPSAAFARLVRKHFRGAVKPPFNDRARAAAGVTPGFYRSLSASDR